MVISIKLHQNKTTKFQRNLRQKARTHERSIIKDHYIGHIQCTHLSLSSLRSRRDGDDIFLSWYFQASISETHLHSITHNTLSLNTHFKVLSKSGSKSTNLVLNNKFSTLSRWQDFTKNLRCFHKE